jgi:broad specificity phosphatase PhoE
VLILVRHGQSEGNAAGLLLGRMESPLTHLGRRQAEAVAGVLTQSGAEILVVSSPVGRARETAALIAGSAPVILDERWAELDYGEYDGLPLSDVPPELWRHWRTDPELEPPGGESIAQLGRRVRQACADLFRPPADAIRDDRHVVVVSHVSPIKAAVAWVLGLGDDAAFRLHLSTGAVTTIAWLAGSPVLHRYNAPSTGSFLER